MKGPRAILTASCRRGVLVRPSRCPVSGAIFYHQPPGNMKIYKLILDWIIILLVSLIVCLLLKASM